MMPTNPYPTYHIDDNLAGARIINWMMMDYGIEGNLYWSVNIYAAYDKALRSYVYRDQWNNPQAYPEINGDGYLVYPGTKYGYAGPIPTIRLEAIRDGLEDYESLYLLKNLSEDLAAKFGINYDFNSSISNLYDLLFDGSIPTADEQRVMFAKSQISDLIEAAQDGVLTVYTRNDKTNKITAEVYCENGVSDVYINGETAEKQALSDGKALYTKQFVATAEQNSFTVKYTAGGKSRQFDKYIGGAVNVVNSFDKETDLAGVEVTDGDEYDDIADTAVELVKENAISGKSLKISLAGVRNNQAYRPNVDFNGITFDKETAGVRFYTYNASDKAIAADVKVSGTKTTAEVYHNVKLAPKSGRYVVFRMDGVENVTDFNKISFTFGHLDEGETRAVYVDNLSLIKESFYDLDEKLKNVEIGTDNFGNYTDKATEIKYTRADGVIFDFEEEASMFHNIQYRYVNPSLSIVHDEKYVTSLNGALRVVVKGQPESGSDYCPAIIFRFDDDMTDMRKVKRIVMDVYVEADRDIELGFNILFRAGYTTANRLELIESGKQSFVYDLKGQQRIMRPSGIVTDVLNESEYYISGVEVWMNNLTAEETPFVLVFDNIRFIY